MTLTGCDNGVARHLAQVTLVVLVDVHSTAILAQQLIVVRPPVAGPVGMVTAIRVVPHRKMADKCDISTFCNNKISNWEGMKGRKSFV